MLRILSISLILICLTSVILRAQSAIETNFDNPLARINRGTISAKPTSLYGKIRSSFVRKREYYYDAYADSLNSAKSGIKSISALQVNQLNTKERVELFSYYISNNSHRKKLERQFNIELSEIDSLTTGELNGDRLAQDQQVNSFLKQKEIDTLALDSLLVLWKFDDDRQKLDREMKDLLVADSTLLTSVFTIPDSVQERGSNDLVNNFRGESFSIKQVQHFQEHQEKIRTAGKELKKLGFKEKIGQHLKSLSKNKFSNEDGRIFSRWRMSSFLEFDNFSNAVLLRPSLGVSVSDRWRVGLLQAITIPVARPKEISVGESGAFTEYDIARFFLHLEWNTNSFQRREENYVPKRNFLIGIGKPASIFGVTGSVMLLYNTNTDEPKKFSFRYEISIY